jgi:AraC-like DNA-binding protein
MCVGTSPDDVPDVCCAINVTSLLRELILEAMRLTMLDSGDRKQRRLARCILDQIDHTRDPALQLMLPRDARARRVAERVQSDLSSIRPLTDLALGSGASVRTIERLFVRQTGMTFGRWLQRVRALHALERLAAGDSVVQAGLAVGYDSTSAFIAMFKRVLGRTPGSYFAARA